jgi:hypothetical protein
MRSLIAWRPSRPVLALLIVAHVMVTVVTLRDISRREDQEVRGPRWFWRIVTPLQMGNSAVYWALGRKNGAQAL